MQRAFLAVPSLALVLALAGQDPPLPSEPEPELAPVVLGQEAWAELAARDRRVGFTRRTEDLARTALEREQLDPRERATALMALGCARAVRERGRLASWAAEGSARERRAATLALGELGLGVEDLLEDLAHDGEAEVAACALLALVRTRRATARERVEALLVEGGERAEDARAALAFSVDPITAGETAAGRLLLELRWNAARAHGLVDGQTWCVTLMDGLVGEPTFLDAVVLRSAARLDLPGVKDHLLGHLLERGGPAAIHAATVGMPDELALLIANELWLPDADGWAGILAAIDGAQSEARSVALLEIARSVPGLGVLAIGLLVRAGELDGLAALDHGWAGFSPAERVLACEAWAQVASGGLLSSLSDAARDPDARVACAARIGLARLGEPLAREELRTALAAPAGEENAVWIEMACRQAQDARVGDLLLELLSSCAGQQRARVASALVLAGRVGARVALREELARGLPAGEPGRAAVRALARYGLAEDLALLRRLFPQEGELDTNVELALSLVAAGEAVALPVLREALWRAPFDRSVLAGAVIIDVAGINTLREELQRPPADATSRDFRRVGFALGEWGGVAEIDVLYGRERLRSGDPVLQGAFLGALSARTH